MKPKGIIHNSLRLECNVSFLNGKECSNLNGVPLIVLDYTPDLSDKTHQTFKFWLKLEGIYNSVKEQLKPELKEFSIWLNEDQIEKLKEFLDKRVQK